MSSKLIVRIAMVSVVLAVAACGTGPGTLGYDPSASEVAFNDPSRITPDYGAQGATGAISFGLGLF